jgi:hypothetical protein
MIEFAVATQSRPCWMASFVEPVAQLNCHFANSSWRLKYVLTIKIQASNDDDGVRAETSDST